ncbi:hypothetical protein BJ965_007727 [Streptomyces luteogriseus]|uniref:Uncharacterized protein n=1 Tax=Streptomyces luteogriseus TaxID=68233 RepID=A0A7W7GM05_9ACTN|nr:hypothetical protein [Streptomyces luteogriseus]
MDAQGSQARAPKLSGPGKDADPLLVLTEAALERYGLPVALTEEERHAGRIPEPTRSSSN